MEPLILATSTCVRHARLSVMSGVPMSAVSACAGVKEMAFLSTVTVTCPQSCVPKSTCAAGTATVDADGVAWRGAAAGSRFSSTSSSCF